MTAQKRATWRAECSACGCVFRIGEEWLEQANAEQGPYGHGLWCPMGCQRDSDNNLSTVLLHWRSKVIEAVQP